MFMGHFLQFPLITCTPLYSTNIQPIFTFTKLIQKHFMGKNLWENYVKPNNIVLMKKMKQHKGRKYAILLKNFKLVIF